MRCHVCQTEEGASQAYTDRNGNERDGRCRIRFSLPLKNQPHAGFGDKIIWQSQPICDVCLSRHFAKQEELQNILDKRAEAGEEAVEVFLAENGLLVHLSEGKIELIVAKQIDDPDLMETRRQIFSGVMHEAQARDIKVPVPNSTETVKFSVSAVRELRMAAEREIRADVRIFPIDRSNAEADRRNAEDKAAKAKQDEKLENFLGRRRVKRGGKPRMTKAQRAELIVKRATQPPA